MSLLGPLGQMQSSIVSSSSRTSPAFALVLSSIALGHSPVLLLAIGPGRLLGRPLSIV